MRVKNNKRLPATRGLLSAHRITAPTGKKNEGFLAALRNDNLKPLQKQKRKTTAKGKERGKTRTGKKNEGFLLALLRNDELRARATARQGQATAKSNKIDHERMTAKE